MTNRYPELDNKHKPMPVAPLVTTKQILEFDWSGREWAHGKAPADARIVAKKIVYPDSRGSEHFGLVDELFDLYDPQGNQSVKYKWFRINKSNFENYITYLRTGEQACYRKALINLAA